jgi:type II secretory pathway pseudopilin PulG
MKYSGMSLLEILLVIALLGVLFATVVTLVRPARYFGNIRNGQRKSDILAIYTAINQYRQDNQGNIPNGITLDSVNSVNICKPGCTESSSQIDISTELAPYIQGGVIPVDPTETSNAITGYQVYGTIQGDIVVKAPRAENNIIIQTTQ